MGFEDLKVWQQAHQLTVEVYKLARQFPLAKASHAERICLCSVRSSSATLCVELAWPVKPYFTGVSHVEPS